MNLSFLAGVPRCLRCPHCHRLVDITKDGFLAGHSMTGRRTRCNGSGMGAQMAREALERKGE